MAEKDWGAALKEALEIIAELRRHDEYFGARESDDALEARIEALEADIDEWEREKRPGG